VGIRFAYWILDLLLVLDYQTLDLSWASLETVGQLGGGICLIPGKMARCRLYLVPSFPSCINIVSAAISSSIFNSLVHSSEALFRGKTQH